MYGFEGLYRREGWRALMLCVCSNCGVDDCPINRTRALLFAVDAAQESGDATSALDAAIEFGCYARETGLRKYQRGYLVEAAREACAEMGVWFDDERPRGRPRKN